MDVNEVDQSLLYQFCRLGTTDKDELVKMLQKLLTGRDLDEYTASFYLDMNNWNLQEAIGSYLDYENSSKLPSMTLVCDSTIGDGEAITPNTKFRKSWRVQNSGTERWPHGVVLQQDSKLGCPLTDCHQIPVPPLEPKDTFEIQVELTSPPDVGFYTNRWRMMTPSGSYFGDILFWVLNVSESGTLALTQQLHHLSTSQSNDVQMC